MPCWYCKSPDCNEHPLPPTVKFFFEVECEGACTLVDLAELRDYISHGKGVAGVRVLPFLTVKRADVEGAHVVGSRLDVKA